MSRCEDPHPRDEPQAGRQERTDDDLTAFEKAMREVEPLGEEDGPATITVRKPRVELSTDEVGEPVRFHIEQWGEPPNERWQATAPGVGRQPLERLRKGRVPIQRDVDLHGLDAERAREEVFEALHQMWERRERGLLIVHGRGLHSEAGPVLKSSLPGWLAAPPHGRRILGFLTAPPELGGAGATLVLLRKRKG